jgi:hypothetical protein
MVVDGVALDDQVAVPVVRQGRTHLAVLEAQGEGEPLDVGW